MITLNSDFRPDLVGFKIYNNITEVYRRVINKKDYRIRGRLLENEVWYEIEIYGTEGNIGYYKNAMSIFKCDTIGNFYNHVIPKLSSEEAEFKAVLEAEYRIFLIDEILETL